MSIDGSPHATTQDEISQSRLVIESESENPHEYVEHKELGSQIERAIGDLREEYRAVILLRHVEGHAYDEIAEILDLPLGTVKTRVRRGLIRLHERLEHLV